MSHSNVLSDYDRKTIESLKESRLLIIDLDGTLIDFEKIDNIIIGKMFPDSRVINSVDNILWKINKLDLFGNGYAGLKLRLAIYSLFSSKYSYKECKREYERLYKRLARIEFLSRYATTLREIIDNGYKVAVVTKNVYARQMLDGNYLSHDFKGEKLKLIVLRGNKKEKFKDMIKKYNGEVCVIGNNLSDDIINSFRIGSPYIYIGKSKIITIIINFSNKFFKKKGIQFKSFDKVKSIFLD